MRCCRGIGSLQSAPWRAEFSELQENPKCVVLASRVYTWVVPERGGCIAQTRSRCTQRSSVLFADALCGPTTADAKGDAATPRNKDVGVVDGTKGCCS